MEFEHVGEHCAFCARKDFLPFRCDCCDQPLCNDHRTYQSHNCQGHSHHSEAPTHVDAQKEKKHCFRIGCSATLGPSNTFQCKKCHQKVCIAHRMPEDHNCVGPVRKSFLAQFQDIDTDKTKKKNAPVSMFLPNGPQQKAHTKSKPTHDHTSHQPPPPPPPPSSGTTSVAHHCPFCGASMESEAILMDHIVAFHPDGGVPSAEVHAHNHAVPPPLPPPPPSNPSLHREVCPICHARFADAIELVRHYEGHNHEGRGGTQSHPPANRTTGTAGTSQCTMA